MVTGSLFDASKSKQALSKGEGVKAVRCTTKLEPDWESVKFNNICWLVSSAQSTCSWWGSSQELRRVSKVITSAARGQQTQRFHLLLTDPAVLYAWSILPQFSWSRGATYCYMLNNLFPTLFSGLSTTELNKELNNFNWDGLCATDQTLLK